MNQPREHVVVIGGGIIGAMCGLYLNRSGHRVTIVDKGKFGAACSHGNCGYVSPSHVLPLPQPGAIKNAIPALLKSNSPLSIRWQWSPSFWKWLWNFANRCNHNDMMSAARGRSELLNMSHELYRSLVEQNEIECEWRESGLLFVFQSAAHFEHYEKTDQLLRAEFGVGADPVDNQQLVELEPALKPGLGGAWYYRGDCHLRPDKLMSSLKDQMTMKGVNFIEEFSVDQFVRENGRCVAIKNGSRLIEGDQFVVATGALTPFLNKHLDCDLQIQPGKGYSITMPHPERVPKIPMILEQHRVAITPMETKYRIGSTMEFAGYDTSINRERLNLLKKSAEQYLHFAHCDPIEEEWYGWRPMTWDGKPVIDRSPNMKNVWMAAGHNMLGISMGTGTGKLVQQMIDGEAPSISLDHFSLQRFRR